MSSGESQTCFIAMPISMTDSHRERYGDPDHWQHVMDVIFKPAITAAGFTPVSPVAAGADMIHARIVEYLERAPMMLCDLSTLNANVMFELGVRTALDMPIAVVAEKGTRLPFDTAVINTHFYDPSLQSWDVATEVEALCAYLQSSVRTSGSGNPLWKHFGLTKRAKEAHVSETPEQALLETRLSSMSEEIHTVTRFLAELAYERQAQRQVGSAPEDRRFYVPVELPVKSTAAFVELEEMVDGYGGEIVQDPASVNDGYLVMRFTRGLPATAVSKLRHAANRTEYRFYVDVERHDGTMDRRVLSKM